MKPAFSDPYDRYCQDTLFFENNQGYLKGLYQQYQQDPSTLSPDWQTWFAHFPLDDVAQEHFCFTTRPSPKNLSFSAVSHKQELQATLAAERLINAYRQWGHRLARLDPLGLQNFSRLPFLNPAIYGLQPHQQVFALNESLSVTDLITRLHYIYGQTLGLEFMHIDNQEEQVWLQQRFEHRTLNFSNTQRLKFYEYLVKTEKFEQFLHTKFPGAKRFSIEGNDTLIPVLAYILENIPAYQTRHLTVGMAHRGRLAVLAHILEKPLPLIMADFQDHSSRKDFPGAGDVKYHQGYTCQKVFHNNLVTVTMMNNASHLESVTPIALGKTYYLQNHDLKKENALDDALAVLIHGDAAFSGQGVVAESLQLSKLAGYHVGGAIHFILNNQIGFSTPVHEARSTWYCSDIAKAFACPILHVNADDTEAVVWAVQLALDYRYHFHKDMVIDIVGYRRHGHNEGDEPGYTQPLMYKHILNKPTVASVYRETLQKQGVLTTDIDNKLQQEVSATLQEAFHQPIKWSPTALPLPPAQPDYDQEENLKDLALKSLVIPSGFKVHPKLARFIENRQKQLTLGKELDWSTAESLAFISLLAAGQAVRLCGQDTKRGTFSQRHAEWIDSENAARYIPLKNLTPNQGHFECLNSPLSEAAAVGFEYGYSLGLQGLTLWEAQFGDFANGAQIIVDQYLSAAYSKWLQASNLTLLLPHGYEGQGPEHSSARLERFLQLSAEDNWRVVVCSTPANFFHLLKSQAGSLKPLIALTPKSLLRHPLAVSAWQDFQSPNTFQTVLADLNILPEKVERVIFCTGKIYYDLYTYRQQHHKPAALIRLEQLYPFPDLLLKQIVDTYPDVKEWVWCQEEPWNMGAWSFIQPQLSPFVPSLRYAGRVAATSPATGFPGRHAEEQQNILQQAFD